MSRVLQEMLQVVEDRFAAYDEILADFYFWEERQMRQLIWAEAWDARNGHLLALLVAIELQEMAQVSSSGDDDEL